MKHLAVLLIAFAATAGVHAQGPLAGQGMSDLRTVIRQAPANPAAARKLSEPERAELRRQLSQQSSKSRSKTHSNP